MHACCSHKQESAGWDPLRRNVLLTMLLDLKVKAKVSLD